MSTRTFATRPDEGWFLNFRLDASSAQVNVSTVPHLAEATVTISGPDEVVDGATEQRSGNSWFIKLPEQPGATIVTRTGPGTTMSVNNVSGGTVIVGGNIVSGSIVSGGGNVTINGMRVSGGAAVVNTEPTIMTVLLPEGSDLRTMVDNGSVDARGSYTAVDHQASNASLYVESARQVEADTSNGSVTIGRASESIDVSTSNGKVRVGASAPQTTVRASNGSVEVQAAGNHRISARTSNGNVTVYRNGFGADIRTRTSNGRERVL